MLLDPDEFWIFRINIEPSGFNVSLQETFLLSRETDFKKKRNRASIHPLHIKEAIQRSGWCMHHPPYGFER